MESGGQSISEGGNERAREASALQRARSAFEECLVVLRGEGEVTVHGCKKILLYSTELIRLKMRRRTLCIRGKGLACTSFSGGIMMLEGRIDAISYETEACVQEK